MSAAFTGTAAALGTELYRGAQAYYDEINDRGGIHGRPISVAVLDDRYEPLPCVMNTLRLLEEEGVFLLSGYVGTPTLTRALPFIKQYAQEHDEDLAVVGVFTGAQPQREPPYVEYVFNIRASYRQEMMALVDQFWRAGAREFGVFYQIDAYGRSGTDGVARGLARRGATIAAEATYARGARFEDDMSLAVKTLREGGVDVVLCTGVYQGCAAFIRSARDLGWNVPISNLSFVGSEALLGLLTEHGRKTGRDYTRAIINSQVVPSYDDLTLPGVREYRALMDKNNPAIPHSLRDPQLHAAELQLRQSGRFHQCQGHRRGTAPGRSPSHQARVPAGSGIAARLRPGHRRSAELWGEPAPGPGQRLLHSRRKRSVGAHHRLEGRDERLMFGWMGA